jgi:hypothetical protein
MVIAQIILLSWWFNNKKFSKKNQPKIPNQNVQIQINSLIKIGHFAIGPCD